MADEVRRVLKHIVQVDDRDHPIGAGKVVLVSAISEHFIAVWTDETLPRNGPLKIRSVRVYGTGHEVPMSDTHIGSAVAGSFVWHLFASPQKED